MNYLTPQSRRPRWLTPALCAVTFAAWAAAQTAPTAPASASVASTAGDKPLELSPFTVSTDRDTGYFAENTLAGSRLNTNIGDLAASITVVTKQQLQDTASIDLNDVFLYEANTEGTGNYTDFNIDTRGAVQDRNAGFQGGAPSLPFSPATSNRVRGVAAADRAHDYYPSIQRLPFDTYNTDSVEISRGPNSILFGLGSPAGIVNQSSAKANLRKTTNEVELRAGSWGAYRGSFNFNRPLVQDKLAIYGAGLFDQRGFQREPSYDITKRAYGAITYKPLKNTVVRASIESYENRNRRPNSITPRDFVTPWLQGGKPSYNPVTRQLTVNGAVLPTLFDGTQTANFNPLNVKTANRAIEWFGNARPVLYIDQGREVQYIMQQIPVTPAGATQSQFTYSGTAGSPSAVRTTRSSGPNTLRNVVLNAPAGLTFAQPGVSDKSVYDWENTNILSGNFGRETATVYNVELEQQLRPDLFLQLGWYREDFKQRVDYYISQQTGVTLYVDTNLVNIDGTPNPFYGRPYIEITQPDAFDHPEDNEVVRATLAYDLDFTKRNGWATWLGRHRLMGLGQEQYDRRSQLRYRPYIAGNSQLWNPLPVAGNPAVPDVWAGNTTQNAIERRFYVGDTTGRVTQDPGLYPDATRQNVLRWFNPATGQWVNENVTVDTALHFVSNRSKQKVRSAALALQDYLLQDRLVTTFGVRRDKSIAKNSAGLTRTSAGLTDPANLNVWGSGQTVSGTTKTYGGVLKPFKGWRSLDASAERGNYFSEVIRSLSFSYNKSDNFTPAGIATDFVGNNLALPTGSGKDYGVGVALFGNKLYAKINWFETSQNAARGAVVAQPLTRTITMDDQFFRSWAQMVTRSSSVNAAAVNAITKLPDNLAATAYSALFSPVVSVGGTSTVEAKGLEATVTYNPVRNWNMKFTAGKQETVYKNVAPEWDAWVAQRLPIWLAAKAAGFPDFWNTTGQDLINGGIANGGGLGSSQRVQDYWYTNVDPIMRTAKRLEGKVSPEQRKWRWNFISTYQFTEGPLKNFGAGGAARWEDRAAIGYLGAAPDPDGVIRQLDVNRPVFDGEQFHLDLWASYTIRALPWIGDKVKTKLQVNVRDALENGGLEPIAINPDGQKVAFRIKDPRQWFVTATFDF